MKLSIIVPIYNVEDCLKRCLDSFQKNKVKDFEVILVDDGSPDSSGKIADEYSEKYENYYAFHKENGGLSDARNYGLNKASGEYVWFVDSDDYITDGAIDEFFRINTEDSADVYCFTIEKRVCENPPEFISYKSYEGAKNGHDFLIFQYENGCFRPEAWRNIYKRSMLLEYDCFFTKGILHEDDEWTPRTLIKAEKIIISDFSAYVYVVRENSIMKQSKFDRHIQSLRFIIEKYESQDFGFSAKLKKLIMDRLINCYISCFAKGQFYNEKQYSLPYAFFKNKMVFGRTRIKVFLYCLNKKLFCKISKLLNR